MKILFLARSLGVGGAERQLIQLAAALHRRGHDVTVAVFYSGHPLETDLEGAGVPLHDLGKRGRWDVAGFLARSVELVRAKRPDIVHSYLSVPNILSALSMPLLRATAVVWGVRASNMQGQHYEWLTRLAERSGVLFARCPDRIIVNSQAGFAYHVGLGYPAPKMRVIENGIDTDRFIRDPRRGAALRASWGVSTNEVLIGLVGRLDPMKGHRVFFEAASRVATIRSDVRFVCVGSGSPEFTAELRYHADRLGLADRMLWQEALPDPVPVYSALDGVCSASLFGEGFSNVIAEAMACGVPCVVTDVGDSARIVQCPRYVARAGDAPSLHAAILALIDDIERGLVDLIALRHRIVTEFSVDRLVTKTESVLAEAMAEQAKKHRTSSARVR
ncbi:MAG: glycosyltransferase [Burkholderiaceae bacterium]|nr:glycosyltransferase [Burkholderiaceae bacterium]